MSADRLLVPELMLKGLEEGIRSRLRERILERIKPDIDAAINETMEALKATIQTYREPLHLRDTIRVILEDRRTESASVKETDEPLKKHPLAPQNPVDNGEWS